MSLKFDLMVCCDLREDTPERAIQVVRALVDPEFSVDFEPELLADGENMWDRFWEPHFLASDPEHEIISHFERRWRTTVPEENHRPVYQYSLQYCGRFLHDDFFYHNHYRFLRWLGTVAEDGFIGTIKEKYNPEPDRLYAIDRHLRIVSHSGEVFD